MYTDDIEYIRGRLVDTIVRYGDEPVMIDAISPSRGRFMVTCTYLKDDVQEVYPLSQFNLESAPLGYINAHGEANYCVRKPMRHDWRQGIRAANLTFVSGDDTDHSKEVDLPLRPLRDTIVGEYPSFKEAQRRLKEDGDNLVAFSRDFALGKDKTIHYKGSKVGSYEGAINLYERFKYLIEYVTEVYDAQNT